MEDEDGVPMLAEHRNIAVISGLRDTIREIKLQPYLEEFELDLEDDKIQIGAMSFHEMEEQDKWLQEERLLDAAQEAKIEADRRHIILKAERESQSAVVDRFTTDRHEQRRVRVQNKEQLSVRMHELQRDFRVCETRLRSEIRDNHGHLLTDINLSTFDKITETTSRIMPSVRQRCWRVEWEHTPQPLRLNFYLLRALKDKVPKGSYVLRCSIYDKLGGRPLRWGNTYRACATQPVAHAGHYWNVDMFVEQNVYLSAPAPADLHPSMVFIFQLYLLASEERHVDKVVGWGALPVSNSRFEVIAGKFKVPLMRGDIDMFVTRFERFETMYKSDLDNWLCNMYIDVTHLSRYHKGQREYKIELMYRSRFLDILEQDEVDASIDAAARRVAKEQEEQAKKKQQLQQSLAHSIINDHAVDPRRRVSFLAPAASGTNSGGETARGPMSGRRMSLFPPDISSARRGSLMPESVRRMSLMPAPTSDRRLSLMPSNEPPARRMSALAKQIMESRRLASVAGSATSGASAAPAPASPRMAHLASIVSPTARAAAMSGQSIADVRRGSLSVITPSRSMLTGGGGAAGSAEHSPEIPVRASVLPLSLGLLSPGGGGAPVPSPALMEMYDSDDEAMVADGGRAMLLNSLASPRPPMTVEEVDEQQQRDEILAEAGVTYVTHDAHDTNPGPGASPEYAAVRQRGLAPADKLLEYKFTVVVDEKLVAKAEQESYITTEAQRKLKYIRQEMVKELHPRQWKTPGYWATILMLFAVFYCRQFTHGIGQSLFLQAMRVPIRGSYFFPYMLVYEYRSDLMSVAIEMGSMVFGCIANIGLSVMLIIVTWVSQSLLGIFPDPGSRLIFCWCLGTFLDPLITFGVDLASLNWYYGDAFRLYRYFDLSEGNGAVGVFLTIFIDALVMMVSGLLLYAYCYKLHMNGRLLDVYHRLHGSESNFVVPTDMEVSIRELRRIVDNSRRWRGQGGGSRRMIVMNYNLPSNDNPYPEPFDPPEGNSITHLSILNTSLNGTAEMHRHFLRFPDGRFCEIFGNADTLTTADRTLLLTHLAANKMGLEDFLYVYKTTVLTRDNVIAYAMMLKKLGFMESPRGAASHRSQQTADDDRMDYLREHSDEEAAVDAPLLKREGAGVMDA
eukprot:TRINITY_DN13872_c0_g1_i1.p1 TRINITY_DN13872_c0_g1~~TRINITY_DN13872_c0_g1_i1.p1  ORF type:complete len:1133 (-),score=303.62 TRINITY_DN13872_c0_g1_i1:160-3558(-)